MKRAVASILCQRVLPREIIIVDDGSTDLTRSNVCLLGNGSRVPLRYHYQENNGPAAARNRGIDLASGEFIAFLDSDDEWHQNKIKYQYEALLAEPSMRISHTQERWLRNGKHLNQKAIHQPQNGDIFDQSLKLCCVGMSTVMARKSLFERYGLFDECLRCCEDYDFWLRISPFEPFLLVEKPLTIKHGGREDQVSTIYREGMDRFRIQALAKFLKTVILPPEKRLAACEELVRRCLIYGKGCMKHGKETEAGFYTELAAGFSREYGEDPVDTVHER